MAVQHNINIVRYAFRRNMPQPKLQPAACKINNQRPLFAAVAVAAHDRDRRTNRAQLIHNLFRTHVAQMPDLIRAFRQDRDVGGQTVVGIRQNQYLCHIEREGGSAAPSGDVN